MYKNRNLIKKLYVFPSFSFIINIDMKMKLFKNNESFVQL